MYISPKAVAAALIASSIAVITGCGISPSGNGAAGRTLLPAISGKLHGGQQPVSGSTIQLYAANMTTNQGASTALLTVPVTTGSDGGFNITGDYTCPASNPLVYIVATGGNPGLPGTVNNHALAMMSLLGTCNDLAANASTTFIFIDELTTVASVQAVASFMTDYAHIGAAPSNPTALAGAFLNATSEVSFSTGQYAGGGAYLVLPYVTMNTLSDIIAACVNTAGGTSGDGSTCGSLLSYAGSVSDTIAATLHMTQNPGQNTAQLYGLIPAAPPFQPYFTTVPTDFTATVGYAVPAAIQAGALDSNGRLWLYTGGYSYNTASNTSTDNPGLVTVYDNNFNVLFTVSPGTGGLYYPTSMSADAAGHVFAVNANNTISEFGSNGAAISPSGGWSTGYASTFTPSGSGNGYISSSSGVESIQVDALGNIFGAPPYTASGCYFEMNSSGVVITPSGNFCTASGITTGDTAATDGSGNAWFLGTSAIAKVNAAGNLAATAPVSQGCFYPQSNQVGYSQAASESVTQSIVYDHSHGLLWGYSETGAGTITDAGAAGFCDFGATTLPVTPLTSSASTTPGSAYTSNSRLISNAVLDGAGSLWFITGGVSESGVVGSSPSTFTGNATFSTYLTGLSTSGTLLTPYNAASNSYGLQPSGLGVNATATGTNVYGNGSGESAGLLGVDIYGNIWAEDIQTNRLMKITGLATANTVNY